MSVATLLCLPFAGAHVDPFYVMRQRFERQVPGLATISHTYPGHGRRLSDPLVPTLDGMAEDVIERLGASAPSGPVLLLGYSMGALIAYEVALRLEELGRPVPLAMFMAATPPHRLRGNDLVLDTDEDLLEHCLQYGLVQSNSFPSPELKALFLPALRNDILAVDRYAVRGRSARPLAAGTRSGVFQAHGDQTVTDIKFWDELTTVPPEYFMYDGGHFFINECGDQPRRDALWLVQKWWEQT